MNLTHKCVTLEEEASRVAQAVELEKEISLLKEDFVDERRLKEGAYSKAQHVMEKVAQFSSRLTGLKRRQSIHLRMPTTWRNGWWRWPERMPL